MSSKLHPKVDLIYHGNPSKLSIKKKYMKGSLDHIFPQKGRKCIIIIIIWKDLISKSFYNQQLLPLKNCHIIYRKSGL